MKTFIVEAGGYKIACEWVNKEGNPDLPWLIFLHEGLGCKRQWKGFPDKLCKLTGLRGVMYDRYGYGESEPLRESRNSDFLRKEACLVLPELLETLSITSEVLLFGHSDGGSIALFYASCYPQRTAGLIAIAPHVFLEDISIRGISDAVRAFEHGALEAKLRKHHGEKTRAMFEGWTSVWLDRKNRDWNMLEELGKITSPTLIIQGDQDNYGSFRQVETILKHIRGPSHALYLNNCGHFPHVEYSETILRESKIFFHTYR
jgi:pimeloyl-ACP methyl ester carboxylesterase